MHHLHIFIVGLGLAARKKNKFSVCVSVCTWCDVELVADGEAPHSSSDTGRKSLPPQLPDPPRSLPTHTMSKINTLHAHTLCIRHTHTELRRRTWCPSAAGSRCSTPPWRWRCCPPVGASPSSDASSSGLPSSLRERMRETAPCFGYIQSSC